jgi:hypothetical protein
VEIRGTRRKSSSQSAMTRDARSHTRNLFQNLGKLLPASQDIWGNLQKVSEAADALWRVSRVARAGLKHCNPYPSMELVVREVSTGSFLFEYVYQKCKRIAGSSPEGVEWNRKSFSNNSRMVILQMRKSLILIVKEF